MRCFNRWVKVFELPLLLRRESRNIKDLYFHIGSVSCADFGDTLDRLGNLLIRLAIEHDNHGVSIYIPTLQSVPENRHFTGKRGGRNDHQDQ